MGTSAGPLNTQFGSARNYTPMILPQGQSQSFPGNPSFANAQSYFDQRASLMPQFQHGEAGQFGASGSYPDYTNMIRAAGGGHPIIPPFFPGIPRTTPPAPPGNPPPIPPPGGFPQPGPGTGGLTPKGDPSWVFGKGINNFTDASQQTGGMHPVQQQQFSEMGGLQPPNDKFLTMAGQLPDQSQAPTMNPWMQQNYNSVAGFGMPSPMDQYQALYARRNITPR